MCRKKLLYICLVAITCCKTVVADNYAILVSAGKATMDGEKENSEYWYDLYLAYEYLLLWENYDSTKVYVFYGDGIDFNTSVNRYKKSLHNWGKITDYDNSYNTMSYVISSLNNVITDEDNLLFYWVMGHGYKASPTDDDSYYALVDNHPDIYDDEYEYSISKYQLVNMINSITHYNKRKILWMTCKSGAMGSGSVNPNNDKTVLLTSSWPDVDSYSMKDSNHLPHSRFNYALYSISTGVYPCNLQQFDLSVVCPNLQSECDSLITIYELSEGMNYFLCPFYYCSQYTCLRDSGNISNSIFIGEEKGLKNVSIDTSSSYWLDEMEVSDVDFDSGINVNKIIFFFI